MEKLFVIKIGGNVIDDEPALSAFLKCFAGIKEKKILVHGGGKMATRIAEAMGIPQQLMEGRRITDAETLKIVTMVYAGYINKDIVARLQANGCNALGLSGADANTILAHKRIHPRIDYGFVGDIDAVDTAFIRHLLDREITPVLSPVTHDKKGSLLNTNADTIAQELGKAMSGLYDTSLVYCFERSGVLADVADNGSVIPEIGPASYIDLKCRGIIAEGMVAKMDNAFAALDGGIQNVIIGKAEDLDKLIHRQAGTTIVHA
jgi:acetylglutamate kinase